MISKFENEVIKYLGLPSLPKKEWDGKSTFDKGVAVLEIGKDVEAYAACLAVPGIDGKPMVSIKKVFGIEPFKSIKKVLVVPSYMSTADDVKDMDLDDDSKKKAADVINEATELEQEGKDDTPNIDDLPEWIYPEITSKDEAVAWLKTWQTKNKAKGKIPTNPETLKLRLFSIYTESVKKSKE